MRRQFALPQADTEHLDASGLNWETLQEQGAQWLIIHERPLPLGYNVQFADTALMLSPGYPDAAIDMVYFLPILQRLDGGAIGALSTHPLDGKQWQRWSRHRTPENPWRPGEDDIAAHLILVDYWLKREFLKPRP